MPVNYTNLSNYYNAKQLIPIIGNEILKIKKGIDENGQDRLLTFEEYFIEEYTDLTFGSDQCPKTISELALRKPDLNSSDIIAIYRAIPADRFDLNLLKKLAGLNKFEFFISTTYDGKLEEVIEKEGKVNTETIFWNHEKKEPLYINFENNARKMIYLFGGIADAYITEEISFSDEDKLECLFNLSLYNSINPSRNTDKFSFLEYLRNKILLFVGNNFQDLFMRFLIRTLYNSPYKNNKSKAYIINDQKAKLGFEKYFFDKYGIQIIHDSPIGEVINTLYDTIQGDQEFKERYKYKVFISYDREDAACAEKINTGLRNRGINSWLDTRDLGIATHRDEIRKVIESTDTRIFISILSRKLADKSNDESYVKSFEWKIADNRYRANEFMRGRGDKVEDFIVVPIAVDDFQHYIQKLPQLIEKDNIQRCNDPGLLDDIEDKIQSQQ
ncbi:MAG: toll/interleukin-1 receptor domain-containing protein [Chitinophagaceae bacterium]